MADSRLIGWFILLATGQGGESNVLEETQMQTAMLVAVGE